MSQGETGLNKSKLSDRYSGVLCTCSTSKRSVALLVLLVLFGATFFVAMRWNINPIHSIGEPIDQFNDVVVYYNGAINNTSGRERTSDGYNLGLRYQCVEFVKRYYFEQFKHRMPNSMGHAKEFFSSSVADGHLNKERMLIQYRNGAGASPANEDIIVFAPWLLNRYGHVAIVSEVGPDFIEVVQQNPGPFGSTRERYALKKVEGRLYVDHSRVLGWLRREQANHSIEKTSPGKPVATSHVKG